MISESCCSGSPESLRPCECSKTWTLIILTGWVPESDELLELTSDLKKENRNFKSRFAFVPLLCVKLKTCCSNLYLTELLFGLPEVLELMFCSAGDERQIEIRLDTLQQLHILDSILKMNQCNKKSCWISFCSAPTHINCTCLRPVSFTKKKHFFGSMSWWGISRGYKKHFVVLDSCSFYSGLIS